VRSAWRRALTYWSTLTYWSVLGLTLVVVGALFLLLWSRTGLSPHAIRDDEEAAASIDARLLPVGCRVTRR
jgi:ABC-type branched-subunit amino acid transport system permease subunit